MNMQETLRFIRWLQADGWTWDEMDRFALYIESGDQRYLPQKEDTQEGNGAK